MADFRSDFKNELDRLKISDIENVKTVIKIRAAGDKSCAGHFGFKPILAAALAVILMFTAGFGIFSSLKRFYVPQRGILSEYPYELYAMNNGIFIGGGYIDAILRTYADDGKSIMSIYAVYERTEDARNIPEIRIEYENGIVLDSSDREKCYGRRNAAGYAIYNFTDVPDSNSFVITIDDESTDIELTEIDQSEYGITDVVSIDGTEIMLYPLPGGGNTFAVFADYVGKAELLDDLGLKDIGEYNAVVDWLDCTAYDDIGNEYVIALENNDAGGDGHGNTVNNRFVIFTRASQNMVKYSSREEAENAPVVPVEDKIVKNRIVRIEITNISLSYFFEKSDEAIPLCDIPNPALSDDIVPLEITVTDSDILKYRMISASFENGEAVVEYESLSGDEAYVQLNIGVSRETAMSSGRNITADGKKYIHFALKNEEVKTIPLYLESVSIQYDTFAEIKYK